LPWNPQRVEQRIGRCHRYGQKHDVVVINFLNKRNEADRRVLELLTEKFNLFDGVFGASDEVLGRIESGIDFEKRILEIYETCRLPHEISSAFTQLQQELEIDINEKIEETQQLLMDNFDEDIHDLLKLQLDQAEQRLDKIGRWFWLLSKYQLHQHAEFNDTRHSFKLKHSPKYNGHTIASPIASQTSYVNVSVGPTKPLAGVYVIVPSPFDVIVPPCVVGPLVTGVIVSGPKSGSISLSVTSIITGISTPVLVVSSVATGG